MTQTRHALTLTLVLLVTATAAPVTAAQGGVQAGESINVHAAPDGVAIIQTGDGTIIIKNIHGIDPETYEALSKKYGVTESAIKSFFKILEQNETPLEDLDSKLREIATLYKQRQGSTATDRPGAVQLGDLMLVVDRPEAPVFWLFDAGPARADKPKYQFLLYDLDQADTDQPRRILHIPVRLFEDYILSQRALGPWKILDLSRRAKEVELGHTVFGYVTVQCANCSTVRYYWVFVRVGREGWTLEVPENESHTLNRMLAKVIYTGEQAISTVDSVVPLKGRKPIQ